MATKEQALAKYFADPNRLQKNRDRARKIKFGLTPQQFESLIAAQEGKCYICEEAFIRTPVIDHCHKTRRIRKLLCNRCNLGVGSIEKGKTRDSRSSYDLDKCVAYIEQHKNPSQLGGVVYEQRRYD